MSLFLTYMITWHLKFSWLCRFRLWSLDFDNMWSSGWILMLQRSILSPSILRWQQPWGQILIPPVYRMITWLMLGGWKIWINRLTVREDTGVCAEHAPCCHDSYKLTVWTYDTFLTVARSACKRFSASWCFVRYCGSSASSRRKAKGTIEPTRPPYSSG